MKTVLPVLLTALILAGCEKDDAPVAKGPVADEAINANTNLSIFAAALKKTRLDAFTKGGGPFTFFAPTNAAFNAMGINSEADLALVDSNLLVQILTYHIQAVSRTLLEIPLGPNATMTTQGGFTQYASRYVGGSAFVNGAQLTTADVPVSNGNLHIINKVLVPGFNTTTVTLGLNSNYKLMLQAIVKTGSTASFTATNATTFAVPNSGMIAAGYDSTTIANASLAALTTLTAIIKHNVIPARIFTPDFKAGNLKTVQGTNLVVSLNIGVFVKGAGNAAPIKIIAGDLLSSNGVIHTIPDLLKP